jgi:hypothetical protein
VPSAPEGKFELLDDTVRTEGEILR